ncbi:alpha/beta fold hydrolase [Nocardia rhamnosiphila]|uniref:dienelactone hydrolase family protein n=1 Tax=Nocardia rhamnosiphila TaxID=426716 RepID=UPI0033C5803A
MTTKKPRHNVTFVSGDGTAHGYLALPPGGSGPGILVIQEWWGLTTHVADVTDRLARAGFVALAPDLYGGFTTHDPKEARRLMTELPVQDAVRDLHGAIDFLLARGDVTSDRVAAIGFCMGGGFVLTMAAQDPERVGAAVVFYGLPPIDVDLSQIRAPVLGHYAEQDYTIAVDDVQATFDRIRASGQEATLHLYSAGHAFFNNENPRGHYNQVLAAIAWSRTLDFLNAPVRPHGTQKAVQQ